MQAPPGKEQSMMVMKQDDVARQERKVRARAEERIDRENLDERSVQLLPVSRALVCAHYGQGVDLASLAAMRGISRKQMARRMLRLRAILCDPCFLLAARFAERLPEELA